MAKKEITSRLGLFGTTNHYDSRGKKIGESRPGLLGQPTITTQKAEKLEAALPVSSQAAFIVMLRGTRLALPMMVCFPPITTIRKAIE